MKDAYAHAVRLLARREHGAHELTQKLLRKGHSLIEVKAALLECQRLGLQSDERFAESLCRTRVRQGYGAVRIQHDLQNLRVDSSVIAQALNSEADNWLVYAEAVIEKKYGMDKTTSYETVQKQKQFLLYRGFSKDVIYKIFNRCD